MAIKLDKKKIPVPKPATTAAELAAALAELPNGSSLTADCAAGPDVSRLRVVISRIKKQIAGSKFVTRFNENQKTLRVWKEKK